MLRECSKHNLCRCLQDGKLLLVQGHTAVCLLLERVQRCGHSSQYKPGSLLGIENGILRQHGRTPVNLFSTMSLGSWDCQQEYSKKLRFLVHLTLG